MGGGGGSLGNDPRPPPHLWGYGMRWYMFCGWLGQPFFVARGDGWIAPPQRHMPSQWSVRHALSGGGGGCKPARRNAMRNGMKRRGRLTPVRRKCWVCGVTDGHSAWSSWFTDLPRNKSRWMDRGRRLPPTSVPRRSPPPGRPRLSEPIDSQVHTIKLRSDQA